MSGSLKQGEFVAALDCGTTSVRFMVFNEFAEVVAEHQSEFPQYYPNPSWHEHDAVEIIDVSKVCIAGACEKLEKSGWDKSSIKTIGITNQRETAVAWSRATGLPLCRAIVWDDARTKGIVLHFEKKLREEGLPRADGNVAKGDDAKAALLDLSGLPLSTYFSAIKLRWMIDHHPEVKEAHEKDDLMFGTVDSWVVYALTGGTDGGLHITDPTNASRTLLMNLKTLQWSPELLKFFNLRDSILPKLKSSSEVYGSIALSDSPLKGVKIAGIAGDQQAALVGNKCFAKGEAKNTYGTGAFLLFNTGHEVVKSNNGLISTVAYQAGPNAKPLYALEGSIAVAGSAVKWLRDSMKIIKSAAEINTLAEEVPNTGGVYFVTAFSGLLAPYWDDTAGGLIIGLSSYTTPSHIARATIEAACYHTRAVIEAMKLDSGVELKKLKVDGGMTNGDIIMQIQADIGGFEVVRPEMRESTALGSAILAASAIKLFGWDVNEPKTLDKANTQGSKVFQPQLDKAGREAKYAGWKRAVEKSKGWEAGKEEGGE